MCYPYHLGWVSDSSATPPVVRYFRNLLTEPDLLTTEVKNLPDMSSNDKLYVPFIADLQLAYQGLKIDPSPIDEFTTDVRQMIANKSPDLATPVQLAQEKYLESKTANNRTALDRVKKPFSLQKAQLLAPRLTKIWTKWSQIQYQHFPSQAFTSGDVPKELVIIDWIFATFSCDASSDPDQDTLNAKMDPVERESKKPSEGEPSSKYVKTSLNNDFISNGKDVVSKAHSIQLLGASGLGTVKRKLTPRRCVSQVTQFLLSVDEENTIERQETEGDDLVPNPAYDPDNNSYWYKLENVQILQRKSTATTVVPSKIYPSDGPTEAGCINLDDASNYDYFVAALEGACLSLSAKALNSGWQGNPDGNDKLLMWIQAFFVDPSGNITMSWSGTSISPYTLAVQLNFELPANSSPVNVTYSSQWSIIKTAFDIQTENQDLVDVNGFYNASTGVVLGIDFNEASAAASMTVKQVFQLLEIPLFPLLDETIALGIHGGSGTSNGVWICPDDNNLIAWRMTLMGTSNQAIEQAYMKSKLPGLTFQNSVIVVTKEGYLQMASSNGAAAQTNMICTGSVSIQATASLNGNPSSSWSTYITLGSNTANLILRWTSASNSPIDDLFQWLGSADGPNLPVQNAYASFKGLLDKLEFHLREFSITADYDASGWHFSACAVVFELDLAWGVPANSDARVPVRLSLAYLASAGSVPFVKFDGEIWQSMVDTDLERLIPGALPYPLLTPDTLHPQDYISLLDMDGIADDVKTNFPRTVVPTYVTALSLTLQSGVNGGISFNGIMQSAEPLQTSSWLQFDRVSVDASYNSELSSVTFGFSAEINLTPRTELEVGMAVLSIDVEYDSNAGWTIEGTVRDLNIGCLYSLFPDADNEAVMNVMENITVSYLGITYDYGQNDFAFAIEGFIELGDIELELLFTRNSSLWEFSATLSSDFSSTGVTLGSVLDGLSSDLSSSLPDFVSGINFTIPTNSFIKLECTKVSSSDNVNGYVILGLIAQVGDFSFSFVQISSGASSDSDGGPNNQAPKRLLKFTMGRLPVVEDVPLLDSLTQPFDSMNFLYASDDFTRDEVNNIVSVVYNGATDQLVYKDPRLETNDPTIVDPGKDILKDKVLRAGCHFQIVVELENQPTPVLDYVFGGPQPPPASFKSPYSWSIEDPPSAPTSAGTATAPWTKTLGPLTINAISLECVGSELNITLDAAVQLGPLSGNVKGFTIAVPLNTLPDLRGISVSLEGIGLEMNRPPVCIAGELVKNSDGSFQGGVALSVEPYLFLAGGYYDDKVENPNNSGTFKSLFVFAELDGPIAEFEFASISGLQGGVGYNSQIMLPTVDSVSSFPFIASSTKDQPSIKAVLDFYMKGSFITPADGPCWIAAGLTVKAFQTLLIKAVIVVDLSDDVRFGIFADVLANIPASAANDSELFARIDMSLLAVIDPAKGTFRAEGQLTPKSFVLDQNCHLLGGFALCYWFEGSGHDGDWVFTVGGYHSAYSPPLWYPRPPRLSISWQYDSDLSIYGEAYFAITPKVCMGGGALKLNYHAGDVQVDFNAYADFLINYSPFTFIADVGVNLNIKYTLDLYFVTKRFDVHFGARLDLWGPPVAGVVHIEWSILTFDIYFGNSNLQQGPLSWSEFSALLRQESGESKPNEDSDQGLHAIAATSGILSNNNNPSSEIYSQGTETMLVDSSTFSFRFTSLFPLTSVTFAAGQRIGPAISVPATYIKPMQIQSTASVKGDLNVTIQDAQGNDGIFLFQLIQKQVPTALWSACKCRASLMHPPKTLTASLCRQPIDRSQQRHNNRQPALSHRRNCRPNNGRPVHRSQPGRLSGLDPIRRRPRLQLKLRYPRPSWPRVCSTSHHALGHLRRRRQPLGASHRPSPVRPSHHPRPHRNATDRGEGRRAIVDAILRRHT